MCSPRSQTPSVAVLAPASSACGTTRNQATAVASGGSRGAVVSPWWQQAARKSRACRHRGTAGIRPRVTNRGGKGTEGVILTDAGPDQVYLPCGSTDLRKWIDGLATLVREAFALGSFAPCLFNFCNRRRDKLKIPHWDRNGFWPYSRRLERGHFQWPAASSGLPLSITRRQLRWLLDGLALEQHRAQPEVTARTIL